MQQDQKSGSMGQPRPGFNPLALVLESFAFSSTVFLRRGFGERYVGLQGPVAMVLILLFAGGSQEPLPLMGFLVAYVFMCFCNQNSIRLQKLRGGPREHSRYNGWPRAKRFFPRMSEVRVKQFVEPGIVLVVGCLVMGVNPGMGGYLMISSLALFATTNLAEEREHKQALDMHDAVIEAQQRAERFRSFRGDR